MYRYMYIQTRHELIIDIRICKFVLKTDRHRMDMDIDQDVFVHGQQDIHIICIHLRHRMVIDIRMYLSC